MEEEGSIYVFKENRVVEFDGLLSANTLVEFLLDVSGPVSVQIPSCLPPADAGLGTALIFPPV